MNAVAVTISTGQEIASKPPLIATVTTAQDPYAAAILAEIKAADDAAAIEQDAGRKRLAHALNAGNLLIEQMARVPRRFLKWQREHGIAKSTSELYRNLYEQSASWPPGKINSIADAIRFRDAANAYDIGIRHEMQRALSVEPADITAVSKALTKGRRPKTALEKFIHAAEALDETTHPWSVKQIGWPPSAKDIAPAEAAAVLKAFREARRPLNAMLRDLKRRVREQESKQGESR